MTKLRQGDKVRYRAGQRKMRGTVVEHLPFAGQREVPVLLRKRVVWMKRQQTRKLP